MSLAERVSRRYNTNSYLSSVTFACIGIAKALHRFDKVEVTQTSFLHLL